MADREFPEAAAEQLRLWMMNSALDYGIMLHLAEEALRDAHDDPNQLLNVDERRTARYRLAETLKDMFQEAADDIRCEANNGDGTWIGGVLANALLPCAVSWVDWDELAEDILENYEAEHAV
jgi:hypothetical protein